MCPACIANMTLIAAGAGSTGGLTALAMKRIFLEPTENIKQTKLEEGKMKIETMEPKTDMSEMNPRVVSEAEWLVARKDLLTREKELTRLRDEVSRHRRELPWVKVDKEIHFRRAGWQRNAGRSLRRSQSIDRISFHVRAGMGGRLQKLLLSGRSLRRRKLAFTASRRHVRGHFARAAV